jgi:23S rRNA (adenine2503-C2)-methyltransferase
MKLIATSGNNDIAMVYLGEMENGKLVEFVESVQPPLSREKKWVLLVSTLFGCPVGCSICDAGGNYQGKPTSAEIFAQIDHLVFNRYPDGRIPCEQFKIQFSRMGEPALNNSVLQVLEELPNRYEAPGLIPSISTIAPSGREGFFEKLLTLHRKYYYGGHFQLQFSIHTTDPILRDQMIPTKKWSFAQIAAYGEKFFVKGDRKITLNFAAIEGAPIDPRILLNYFDPEIFIVKVTPLNPTYKANDSGLSSYIQLNELEKNYPLIDALRLAGYQVLLSVGDLEENLIGSNCGQFIKRHLSTANDLSGCYTYSVDNL